MGLLGKNALAIRQIIWVEMDSVLALEDVSPLDGLYRLISIGPSVWTTLIISICPNVCRLT